jgi:hypothetical protein
MGISGRFRRGSVVWQSTDLEHRRCRGRTDQGTDPQWQASAIITVVYNDMKEGLAIEVGQTLKEEDCFSLPCSWGGEDSIC